MSSPTYSTIVCAIFIALFALAALRLFRGYKKQFLYSALCYSFCIARCVALGLRIGLARSSNPGKGLIIVTQIMVSLGTILVYIVLLQMSRRLWGQTHPRRARVVKLVINGACWLFLPVAIMSTFLSYLMPLLHLLMSRHPALVSVIIGLTTNNSTTISQVRTVRRVAAIIFVLLAFLPVPVALLAYIHNQIRESSMRPKDTTAVEYQDDRANAPLVPGEPKTGFGPKPATRRELLINTMVIVIPSLLLTVEQAIRTAQAFYVPNASSIGHLPWVRSLPCTAIHDVLTFSQYMSKAAFYVFIFGMEFLAILILGLAVLPVRFSNVAIERAPRF